MGSPRRNRQGGEFRVWANFRTSVASDAVVVAVERKTLSGFPPPQGLYDPRHEHDSCGVGFVANIKGRKSHEVIACGLEILVNLDHRGAVGADPLVGDGAGCLIQIPDALLPRLGDQGRARAAAARRLRRRHVLPAAGRGGARAGDRPVRALHPRRGPAADRLARRAGRSDRASARRCCDADAGDPPGVRRPRRRDAATRTPSSASSWSSASRPRTRWRSWPSKYDLPGLTELLHALVLQPHGGLQGPAARPPGRHVSTRT